MRNGTIEATEIWKRFRADLRSTYLQDELSRVMSRMRGTSGNGGWRWVLREVDVKAEQGSSVGLVGVNGSGKSTLLKILTRVMYPTAGNVRITGRVGALIELRAGMHPNLTGRENIFLTGSLMGLKRRHVAERFDEIVAFAELSSAIDRQVKYYSAGMQMRLGFGVAAFLEPDVLLVDEVLAVGDAAFQQRCLDRMREVLDQGTTLVFVSHDLAAVEAACRRGLWLSDGEVVADGPIREVLAEYRATVEAEAEAAPRRAGSIALERVEAGSLNGEMVRTGGTLNVDVALASDREYRAWIYVGVSEGTASPIFLVNPGHEILLEDGITRVRCSLQALPLPRGRYYLWLGVYRGSETGSELLPWQPVSHVDVYGPEIDPAPPAVVRLAPIHVPSEWTVQ